MTPNTKRPAPDGFPATGRVILITALGQRRFYQDRPSLSTRVDAFGWSFARALDQADFVDRAPGEMPGSSPEARFK